jgi:ferredoxin
MRVRVDVEMCTGHARCIVYAPDVFELDDVGYNVTPVKDVPPDQEENVRRAVLGCPEQAISIEE